MKEQFTGYLIWKPGDNTLSSPWFTVRDNDGIGFSLEEVLKKFEGKDVEITISTKE